MCAICANMCFPRCALDETEMLTPSPIQFGRESAVDTARYDRNETSKLDLCYNRDRRGNYTQLFFMQMYFNF